MYRDLLDSRMMINGLFNGHIIILTNLSSSFYISFTIAALTELPADLMVLFGLDRVGRRWSVTLALFFSGLSMIICGFFVGEENWNLRHSSFVYWELIFQCFDSNLHLQDIQVLLWASFLWLVASLQPSQWPLALCMSLRSFQRRLELKEMLWHLYLPWEANFSHLMWHIQ